jgi:RNA polymerase sigma-70 factor (ECF subfamily)
MREHDLRTKLEEHHRDAFGWALSCCRWDRTLADDVLQSSYLKVLDGKARFSGRSGFKTWLFAVIRRTASEYRRRTAMSRLLPLGHLTEPADTAGVDPIDDLTISERNARLVGALRKLPRRQREVLNLVFYHDLTIREAAEVSGVSIGSARTHYERGKQQMRKWLAEEDDL